MLDLLMQLVQMEGAKETESRNLLRAVQQAVQQDGGDRRCRHHRNCCGGGRRSHGGAVDRTGPTPRLTLNTIVVSQRVRYTPKSFSGANLIFNLHSATGKTTSSKKKPTNPR
ncbi:hypothetical protein [Salinispora mooreana]|uniref:hypothetical protein n=1 Tax=Salinispora mooreana TaxID=999545 RepID=UPI0013A5898C|nr:hypothetical protein [Salinispora mooreana]